MNDNVYLDLCVSNFQSTNTKPVAFNYNDNRSIPFLENPQAYELTIVRFSLDTATAPVFLPSIQSNQADPNLTIYSITMEYPIAGQIVVHQEYLRFNPQDKSAAFPAPPNQTFNKQPDFSTGYYNIYNYSFFIFNVNQTITACFNNLKAKVLAIDPASFFPPHQPIITWDTSNDRAVITTESQYFDQNPLNTTSIIRIYMNPAMFNLFSSFPIVLYGYEGITLGRNFLLGIVNVGSLNQVTIAVPYSNPLVTYDAIQTFQEYSTVSAWSPIQAIVFTSNTLPVLSNAVSPPVIYNDQQLISTPSNNTATANIITDIVTNSGQYAPSVLYEPAAQYRMITLFGNEPLTNIDLQIYYRLRDGSLVPFVLSSGGSVSVKLGFFKKNIY